MRKLMWFAIGFGAACAVDAYIPNRWLRLGVLAALTVCIAICLFSGRAAAFKILVALIVGCSAGFLWFSAFTGIHLRQAQELDGQTVEVTLEAADYSIETSYGSTVECRLKVEGKTYQVKAYLNGTEPLSPGDTVTGKFRFQLTTPSGADVSTYYRGKGIFLLAYPSGTAVVTHTDKTPLRYYPAVWRQWLLEQLAVTAFSWITPVLDDYRMTVLDVGQGQCIILQCEGKTFLVDCGGDYAEDAADIAAETLLSQGISRVDGIIVTHFDEDHMGGVEYLLTRIDTNALLLPDYEQHTLHGYENAIPVSQTLELAFGNAKITLIPAENGEVDNEWSMCVLFQTEKCDILITGDRNIQGELELMKQITLPDLEVLVVGHHGSRSSTSDALLAAATPEVAVISVGEGNRYAHPAEEVLERLENYGCEILRTDQEGTIIYRG